MQPDRYDSMQAGTQSMREYVCINYRQRAREDETHPTARMSPLKKRVTKRVVSAAGVARFDNDTDNVGKISRNVKTC